MVTTRDISGSRSQPSASPDPPPPGPAPSVFLFNPFSEAYIAHGKAFTPVKHQAALANDLANLPQFLCQPADIVLVTKRPATAFLDVLQQAGFPTPHFVELHEGRIQLGESPWSRELGSLRPWAWGPDSLKVLQPLFTSLTNQARNRSRHYFNDAIAQLYSKAWSASFLRRILAHGGAGGEEPLPGAEASSRLLCSEQEAGTAVDTLEDALAAIDAIRRGGHHRVIVKQAHGLAGHNAIRLWEPALLPAQRRWLADALDHGQPLVVEPWLERELDFSVQLEMGASGLELCGYTGLLNDRKGQFLANWAEPDPSRCLPAKMAALFFAQADEISPRIDCVYRQIRALLEPELRRAGFIGPISIDALVYRTREGDCRLKPVVEINPRYTMGRVTLELMKHAQPGTCGLFRLVSRVQALRQGFADLATYARDFRERRPLALERVSAPRIRQGALCLSDPEQAQVCLATFEVGPTLTI